MSGAEIGYLSPTVALQRDGTGTFTACAACGHALGPAAEAWKDHTVRRETPLAAAGGQAYDTGHEGVLLRQFFCPSCAALLDTETATERDPALIDRLTERR
jgi:acetone carboxylase gamma subunit